MVIRYTVHGKIIHTYFHHHADLVVAKLLRNRQYGRTVVFS